MLSNNLGCAAGIGSVRYLSGIFHMKTFLVASFVLFLVACKTSYPTGEVAETDRPIIVAANSGDTAALSRLLQNGSNPNAANSSKK
jgi:hypothetical protein